MPSKTPTYAYPRVLSFVLDHPWALTRPMLSMVAGVLSRHLAGVEPGTVAQDQRRGEAGPTTIYGVAVLPIHGVLAPRMNLMSDMSDGATFEGASVALAEAVAAPDVATIILDWDSPGGSVAGADEFAAEVMRARTLKPIISHANFEMCSAAYWAGACATEIVAAPSAMVGSIGVYSIHEDLSAALEQLGVKLTYIAAGKYKVDGNETEPLSDSARARTQATVDAFYERFTDRVAKGRGITPKAVRSGYAEGAAVTADEALALGMVDRIATLDETIARVQRKPPKITNGRAEIDAPPMRADTPQEPSPATGQDRRTVRELEAALLSLGL